MTAHVLHAVIFNDGTNPAVTLEPPRWDDMTYQWSPVEISSVFESYDGSAKKQINSGATQKWRLSVAVTGCREPILQDLDQDVTWTVTIVDREDITATQAYTLWPVSVPPQSITANGGDRTWTMEFRQE